MTRSYKYTDKDHSTDAAEQVVHLPKFFAKTGYADVDPKKVKKSGGGSHNWGAPGVEVEDTSYKMTNPRRRSNSSSQAMGAKDFKTKFEVVEPEPVFEDMPFEEEEEEHVRLEHQTTVSSTSDNQSIEGDHN